MSIDENELLELNADLMVLIREKQEQGALDDAISLQIVLHKNLMRLRLFMAAPDKPIPDAPRDWMPPMPTPDSPSTGDSEGGVESGDDQATRERRAARKGKGKQKQRQQTDAASAPASGASAPPGGAAAATPRTAGVLPGFNTDGDVEGRSGGAGAREPWPGPQSARASTSSSSSSPPPPPPSSSRRKYRPRKKKAPAGLGSAGGGLGALLYPGVFSHEKTASHIPSSIPFVPTGWRRSAGSGSAGLGGSGAAAAPALASSSPAPNSDPPLPPSSSASSSSPPAPPPSHASSSLPLSPPRPFPPAAAAAAAAATSARQRPAHTLAAPAPAA
ncbi:unnamed protein product, partial [Scytosiphon promiscuus]